MLVVVVSLVRGVSDFALRCAATFCSRLQGGDKDSLSTAIDLLGLNRAHLDEGRASLPPYLEFPVTHLLLFLSVLFGGHGSLSSQRSLQSLNY